MIKKTWPRLLVKTLVYAVFILFVGVIFFGPDRYQMRWYRENVWELSYEGVLVKKFIEPTRKDQAMYLLSDGNAYLFFNGYAFEHAKPGDSIIKIAGSLKFHLKSRDTAFDYYPTYSGVEIKDSEVQNIKMPKPWWEWIFF